MKKGASVISAKILLAALAFTVIASSCGSSHGCAAYGKYGKTHKVNHR